MGRAKERRLGVNKGSWGRWLVMAGALGVGVVACSEDEAERETRCGADQELVDGVCVTLEPGCAEGVYRSEGGLCGRDQVDWSRDARLPAGGDRHDLYRLGPALPDVASAGLQHALVWPVDVSGVLLPWRPMQAMLDPHTEDPQTRSVQDLARGALGFGTLDEMYDWLGLATAPGEGPAFGEVPWPAGVAAGDRLGAGVIATAYGDALTFSCATCHTAQLFGRTVVGLTNRQAQANEFFHMAKSFFPGLTPRAFGRATGADETELELFVRTQANLRAIGSRMPQVRGLDTSLAQVSLSLARRGEDAYALRDRALELQPRPNMLDDYVSDSKPAVWWTMRYKTRWLSDGSIVSGNPVFTNFLWNELGRGTDLRELEAWLEANPTIVDELTALVFATEPPRWEEFFGVESLNVEAAQRGEALFLQHCSTCHGSYDKGWSLPDAASLDPAARVQTVLVRYHEQTPVFDVGTSPNRARGMAAFAADLNRLAISHWMATVVEVQEGYVPPPLTGIWARYPYLHNQSVPNLCEMLLPSSMRSSVFYMGPDEDPETDYDQACVGLPTGDAVPASWQEDPRRRFDTSRPGLSNAGHDAWLTAPDGQPLLTAEERRDLIEFLKTL